MLTQQELSNSPLFQGIDQREYLAMVHCFQAVRKTYQADDVIWDMGEAMNGRIGIVEMGQAAMIRIDEEGTSTVLEGLHPGGVFGKSLTFASVTEDSIQVIARTTCEVLFIDHPHIFKRCQNACVHHSVLVQNLLRLMEEKAQALSERVDVLSRRSIREKLLCYFYQLSEKEGTEKITLPFSLSVLADYIATDRSAMMRELKRLREDGIVDSKGRTITLNR